MLQAERFDLRFQLHAVPAVVWPGEQQMPIVFERFHAGKKCGKPFLG